MQAIFQQMLLLALFLLLGYGMRKLSLLPDNSASVLSQLENRVLMPALIIQTFMTRCTVENLREKGNLALYCAGLIAISIVLAYLISPRLSQNETTRVCYRYSLVIPNFAFMGNAVVLGVFGQDVLFDYMIFTIPLNLFAYSIGIGWLIPKPKLAQGYEKKRKIRINWNSFANPIFCSLLIGLVLGLTEIPLPAFLKAGIESAGSCMSPIAMLLTGFVIGSYSFRSLLMRPAVYVMTGLRLLVIPIGAILLLKGLHAPAEALRCTICAFAMPMGLNTIIIPAAYGGDTKVGASMALVSHALSVVTIPVLMNYL